LVISGDLLNAKIVKFPWTHISWIADWSASLPADLPTFLVSGKHDVDPTHPILSEGKWLRLLKRDNIFTDGDAVELGGYCFECVGSGGFPKAKSPNPKIVISHIPPRKMLEAEEHGSPDVSRRILRSPANTRLVLCGHIYKPKPWISVGFPTILNPGSDRKASQPNYIVVDTNAETACRYELGQTQTVSFGMLDKL
jgi:3',5'-cyclic AMP phosphodiesterase CpdA